jgi:glycosyltransferase involved in cell wall biosynthesis
MMLSVIIPTRDRAPLLQAALRSLEAQTLAPERYEVIVVDNGSRDETPAVINAFEGRLPGLQHLSEPEPGLHAGRHRGLQAARGDILVYGDDDIEAEPGWLKAIAAAFADPAVMLVGGNNLPNFETPPPDWLLRLWETPRFGGRAIPELSILKLPGEAPQPIAPTLIWGCNFSIRKSALLAAGGFHPDGVPKERAHLRGDGETYVAQHVAAHGGVCLFHPGATVHHRVAASRMTMEYFRDRSFNQGLSDSYTALRARHLGASEGGARRLPILQFARALARRAVDHLRAALTRDPDLRRLRQMMAAAYWQGREFHQRAFATNQEVRAWVLKASYLGLSNR